VGVESCSSIQGTPGHPWGLLKWLAILLAWVVSEDQSDVVVFLLLAALARLV
jgi:hypothetical protein